MTAARRRSTDDEVRDRHMGNEPDRKARKRMRSDLPTGGADAASAPGLTEPKRESQRTLDWRNATASRGRIAVPLDGASDDYWLDRFHMARSQVNRTRADGNLPHLQIELREEEIAATGVSDGEHDSVKRLLSSLVDAANHRNRPSAQHAATRSAD
jgi:hypothetical protein